MPLSTSSSDQQSVLQRSAPESYLPPPGSPETTRAVRAAVATLIAALVSVLGVAELGARYLYPRASRLEHRIVSDEREVASLIVSPERDPPAVLLVGNSLLLHALDYPKIQQELGSNVHTVRYVIENTSYLDWYYGLRRLFTEGVRPSKVVLCLNLPQTLSNGVLSSSPRQLFRAGDLLAVSRDAGMDTTQTSNLVFSHFSAFYASREGIRNYILNVADEPYAKELHGLARQPPKLPSEDEMLRQSRARLRDLDKLCREHGSQFLLVVPPSLTDHSDLLLTAGSLEGVDVDAPVSLGSLGPEFFLDRFHLNEKGAVVFTEALARDLRARLGFH